MLARPVATEFIILQLYRLVVQAPAAAQACTTLTVGATAASEVSLAIVDSDSSIVYAKLGSLG